MNNMESWLDELNEAIEDIKRQIQKVSERIDVLESEYFKAK